MSRGSILIVDDSEVTLEICREVLRRAGYDVAIITSPLQITPAIQEHRPHVILLDVRMPALSGEKAAQILSQYNFSRNITVLLHSSLSDEVLEKLVESTGVAGYVKKSTMGADLVQAIEPWVARAKLGIE